MSKSARFAQLDTDYEMDRLIRRARAAGVYPFILLRAMDHMGVLTDDQLDPWVFADAYHFPEQDFADGIQRMKDVGLLTWLDDDARGLHGWELRGWAVRYCRGGERPMTPAMRKARQRSRGSPEVTEVTPPEPPTEDVTPVTRVTPVTDIRDQKRSEKRENKGLTPSAHARETGPKPQPDRKPQQVNRGRRADPEDELETKDPTRYDHAELLGTLSRIQSWKGENWATPNPGLARLAISLADGFTRAELDEALASPDLATCHRPYGLENLLRRAKRKPHPKSDFLQADDGGGAFFDAALKRQMIEVCQDADAALRVYDDLAAGKEPIPKHLIEPIVDAHVARGLPIPPALKEPPRC